MKSLITTFCIAALCWVAVPGSAYSQDDTISAEDFDAAVAAAVADAIEGLAKQEDLSGFEGRIGALETSDKIYTQDDLDAAVASATDGMYTQDQYDAATEGMYTQAEYDSNASECTTTVKWMKYCSDAFKGGECGLHDNTYPRASESQQKTIMTVNGVYFLAQGGYYNSKYYVAFDRIGGPVQPDVSCDADTGECTWTE